MDAPWNCLQPLSVRGAINVGLVEQASLCLPLPACSAACGAAYGAACGAACGACNVGLVN